MIIKIKGKGKERDYVKKIKNERKKKRNLTIQPTYLLCW